MNEKGLSRLQNDSMLRGNPLKKSKKGKFLTAFLVILLLLSLSATVFYYNKYRAIRDNPASVAGAETKKLTTAVGKLIKLPADELPTIATVKTKINSRISHFSLTQKMVTKS